MQSSMGSRIGDPRKRRTLGPFSQTTWKAMARRLLKTRRVRDWQRSRTKGHVSATTPQRDGIRGQRRNSGHNDGMPERHWSRAQRRTPSGGQERRSTASQDREKERHIPDLLQRGGRQNGMKDKEVAKKLNNNYDNAGTCARRAEGHQKYSEHRGNDRIIQFGKLRKRRRAHWNEG